jgi:hypothetical protein
MHGAAVDALNCQRAIAAQVVEQGGDHVLALKANQGTLHEDVGLYLDDPARTLELTGSRDGDGDHDRIETCDALLRTNISWLQEQHQWPGLAAIRLDISFGTFNADASFERI